MSKNKIEEILKKATPPSKIDESKKQQLRRDLLNSEQFEKNPLRNFLLSPKYIFAGVAVAIIAVLAYINLNQQITIEELRSKTNSQYADFSQSTNYASFNNQLTLFGTDNSKMNFEVDQVFDPVSKDYYLKVYDDKRIEELDELIINDGKLYRSENPRIKTTGTVSSLANSRMKIFVINDSTITDEDLMLFQHGNNYNQPITTSGQNGYIVYNKPVKTNDELPNYKLKPFYKEVPKEVDLDKYFRTNPIDIANEIDTAKQIDILGKEYDADDSQEYQLIQLTNDIDNNVAAAYEFIIAKLDSIASSEIKIESIDSITKINIDKSDSLSWSYVEGDSLNNYKELKTIAISASSGRIHEVRFSILKNDIKINLSEIRFIEQAEIPADTSYFNYKKRGLIFVSNLK